MTRTARVSFILLLSVPLQLGAVASERETVKQDLTPGAETLKATPEMQGQPTSTSQPTTLGISFEPVGVQPPMPASTAANYAIDWYSINGGGTVNATSTNYKMGASVGQSVAGEATSASYRMGIGFWHGAGDGCACDCHADPGGNCDGVQTVLDVVEVVNVAFRNAAAIPDPSANCPYQTTDVNCDSFTTVIDVVKMVNVAFRNGNPATEFCNPCP